MTVVILVLASTGVFFAGFGLLDSYAVLHRMQAQPASRIGVCIQIATGRLRRECIRALTAIMFLGYGIVLYHKPGGAGSMTLGMANVLIAVTLSLTGLQTLLEYFSTLRIMARLAHLDRED